MLHAPTLSRALLLSLQTISYTGEAALKTSQTLAHTNTDASYLSHQVMLYPVLLVLFVTYPMTTYATLSHFNCQDLGDGLRLVVSDYRVACTLDDKTGLLFVWSLFFGVLYSVGTPLLFYYCMVSTPAIFFVRVWYCSL